MADITIQRYFELREITPELLVTRYSQNATHYLYKIHGQATNFPHYAIITTNLDGFMIDIIPYITGEMEARGMFEDIN